MADDEIVQTVRFTTEGGEDVVKVYEDIAKAAEESARKIAESTKDAGKGFDGLQTNLKGLADTFKRGFGEGMKGVIEPITTALNRLSGGTIGAVVNGFASIGRAFQTVREGARESTAALKAFDAAFQTGGVAAFGGAMNGLRAGLGALIPVIGATGVALGSITAGVGLAATAIGGLVSHLAEARIELDKQAQVAGVTTDEYEKLVFAFEQFNGHAESVAGIISRIQKAQQQADDQNKRSIGTWKDLGINLLDASGNARKWSDVLAEAIEKTNNFGDAAQKNAARAKLFGQGIATDLVQGLDAGVDKLVAAGATLDDFKPKVDGVSESANDVSSAFGRLGKAAQGTGDIILGALGTSVAGVVNALADAWGGLNNRINDGTGIGGIFVDRLLEGLGNILGETNPLVQRLTQVAKEMGLIKPQADKAAQGLDKVGDSAKKTNQIIVTNGQTGQKKIIEIGVEAVKTGEKFGLMGEKAEQTIKVINGQTGKAKEQVVSVGQAAEGSAKGFSILDDASKRTYKGFQAIEEGAQSAFGEVEKSSAKALDRLAPEAEQAGADVEKVAAKISESFKNVDVEAIGQKATNAAKEMQAAFDGLSFTSLETTFDGIFNGASDAANAAVTAIQTAFDGLTFTSLETTFDGIFNGAIDAANEAVKSIQSAFDGFTAPTLEATLDGIFNGAVDAANTAITAIQGAFDGLSFTSLETTLDGIFNGAVDAANAAVTTIQTTFDSLTFSTLEASFDGIFNGAIDAANAAVTTIQQAFNSINFSAIAQAASSAFQSAGQAGQQAAQLITSAFAQFNVSGIVAGFQQLGQAANSAGSAIQSAASRGASALASIVSAADRATGAMNRLKEAADAAFVAAQRANAEAAKGGGKAQGGPIYGRGSSTSDSIPAMLSHGEWVIRAAAVRKYGHAFMAMLNGMRLPKNMLERILGFAEGGMVNLKPNLGKGGVMHFASGGSVPSKRTLNLTIGGQSFDGLLAPEDVAEKLVRFALNEKVRSAGRKPGWYTGR